ncbi:MAG TPA: type IV pilus biogenesis/stability protein PilW [Rhodocyclaceae bacterium]|nr:type IV pilus biogenesis/stability protein PilW [Rhodocyclaceae bacterium]
MIEARREIRILALLAGLALLTPAIAQQMIDTAPQGAPSYIPDPRTRAKIHTELGAMYFQDGNMAVALDELRTALESDSGYAPAYSVRGLVRTFLRETEAAEEDFRRALRLAPEDPEINNNYGWFLCQNGKERQSIAYFLNAIKNPLYATPDRAYTNAGGCALKAGDMEGAERYLQQAIRMSKDGGIPAQVELANLNYRRGTLDEARRLINEALKGMEPATPEALWLALRIDRKLGNRQSESTYASQLRSRYPASKEYQEFLKGNFE